MILIGIHGAAGVGKTTLAEMFALQLQGEILPFAKPLKEFAKLLGWDGKKDDKGRKLLQLLGTEIGRNLIDEDIWVSHWDCALGSTRSKIIIADDLRFLNESRIIANYHGILIKMTGRGAYVDELNDLSKHASEQPLPDYLFDHIIDNSGTKEQLFKHMMTIVKDENYELITKVEEGG